MLRQSANSAIRFTTYTGLKQLVQGQTRPGQTLPAGITFGIGALAGLVTVYTTMPLECVLARVSGPRADARAPQRGEDAHAVARRAPAVPEHVPLRVPDLHRGGPPPLLDGDHAPARAARRACAFAHASDLDADSLLQMSGGITFTVYEQVISVIGGRQA
jgi:hypothetical protein